VSAPVITLLTDYGLTDGFVGICHGVIAAICPDARIIDLTHGIARHDVRSGALVLAGAIGYLPAGVHVAVVDPDVGAERRAVALASADGRLFVGPDNGVLWPAAQACGGVSEAVEIGHSSLRLEPVSATFHGRDIFAPVAAHLALGVALGDAGRPLDPGDLVSFELPQGRIESGELVAAVSYVDRFGNVQLGVAHEDLDGLGLRLGGTVALRLGRAGEVQVARYVRTFADAGDGELIVYEDASRQLAIALNLASAADRLGLAVGDEVRLSITG
jgi:S-adenosyl-L-methionine hydrolase (adenosine-forming)